ncbi:hypothetical protein WJX84_004924 [Apatococcus fuscideae]|uniref:Uncharacterized protein n=1 Tax=Apatococcus fuscideae TaxID=2026836 RepID=A0AAW1SRJ5_9CHLO
MEVEERETQTGPAAELATGPAPGSSDSEEEEAMEVYKSTEQETRDTTAEEHKCGKDVQGIPWHLLNFTRQEYRNDRVRQYENYMNLEEQVNGAKDKLNQEVAVVSQDGQYFDFCMNHRSITATVVHFQLRNLVWPTSNHDVFLSHQHFGARGGSVLHCNTAAQRSHKVLDLTGSVCSEECSLNPVQISTTCVAHDIVAVGGFNGELVVKSLAVERPISRAPAGMQHMERIGWRASGHGWLFLL